MSVTLGADATWDNFSRLPAIPGLQKATYSTEVGTTAGIAAPRSFLNANPLVLAYCQDPGATDPTASVLDVESGAATIEDIPDWLGRSRANWHAGTTPGQRWPAIYLNGSNLTAAANIIVAAKIVTPVPVILAKWGIGQAAATADVNSASGPFPIAGLQFADPGPFDWDVYSTAWLANVSRHPAPPEHGPYRHLATGHQSLEQVAVSRGTTASHLAAVSEAAYGKLLAASPMPAGTEWWSTNA